MNFKYCFLLFVLFASTLVSQEKKSSIKPYKLGLLYNYGSEDNFLFDDRDYTYTTNTIKAQAFYNLGNFKSFDFELIVQPQIQLINHQLINPSYVTFGFPTSQEYLDEITKQNHINLYALEFGFFTKTKVIKKLDINIGVSLGFAYIDKKTERLARGFTFIENFSLGFSHPIFRKSFFYIGSNFGHVSNLNFQKPNDGYNILGLEFGYSFIIN